MLAIMNSLNIHSLPIFQPILIILVSKFMVHRALSDKTYLGLTEIYVWFLLPTYPNFFNPTLNIKMVFGEKNT